MDRATRRLVIEFLSGFITPSRHQRILEVLSKRTPYLTVVLEDIYQSHNASAVLRSCECFGIQDVHIIENRNVFEVSQEVAMGSSKWLDLHRYNQNENNTLECLHSLRSKGFTLVATSPHENDYTPATLPLDKPVALLFGTELGGLTPEALSMADAYLRIPMAGFTESFNISVSAAICLYELSTRIRNSELPRTFSEDEYDALHLRWLKASIKSADFIIERFLKNKQPKH
ncbi:MAG: RNA methyltransferase [Bacteroidales bacterium]|jgi:tRNA (guanosine-2'-O-)-methyltransferase|nr:RNA methyltransferase [Bacteroidales bacterium]NLM92233.1 RNA methyltransferase [Bacteroidales bacterium]